MSIDAVFQSYADQVSPLFNQQGLNVRISPEEQAAFQETAKPLIEQLKALSVEEKIRFLQTPFQGKKEITQPSPIYTSLFRGTPLFHAIRSGNASLTQAMLAGLPLEAKKKSLIQTIPLQDARCYTLLHYAIYAGDPKTIQVLFKACENDPKILHFLLETESSYLGYPLHHAAMMEHHAQAVDAILTDGYKSPSRIQAALENQSEYTKDSPLHIAVRFNRPATVSVILKHLGNAYFSQNQPARFLNLKNKDGQTVPSLALSSLSTEALSVLLPVMSTASLQTLLEDANKFSKERKFDHWFQGNPSSDQKLKAIIENLNNAIKARKSKPVEIQPIIDRIKAKRLSRRGGFLSKLLNALGKPTRLFKKELTKTFLKMLADKKKQNASLAVDDMNDLIRRFEYAAQYLEIHLHQKKPNKKAILKKAERLLQPNEDVSLVMKEIQQAKSAVQIDGTITLATIGLYKEEVRSFAIQSTYDAEVQAVLKTQLLQKDSQAVDAQKYLNQTKPKLKRG